MKSVYEIVYRYVFPAIKKRLAEELQILGYTEKEVAKLLKVSQPLISRYNKGERGSAIGIAQFKDLDAQIKQLAREIAQNNLSTIQIYSELHKLAAYFMAKKFGCALHKKLDGIDPTECSVCPTIFSFETRLARV
uniref:Transcriptional regulator n=1 Tax=Ignisphaera aggregans TaxID=334771 RepID=A0A7C4BB23_9CREN